MGDEEKKKEKWRQKERKAEEGKYALFREEEGGGGCSVKERFLHLIESFIRQLRILLSGGQQWARRVS